MLMLYEGIEEDVIIHPEDVEEICACAVKVINRPILEVIKYKSGKVMIINQNPWITVEVMGYQYFKSNGYELYAEIGDKEISRLAICRTIFSNRILEIIEFKDNDVWLVTLTKFIIVENIPIDYIMKKINELLGST